MLKLRTLATVTSIALSGVIGLTAQERDPQEWPIYGLSCASLEYFLKASLSLEPAPLAVTEVSISLEVDPSDALDTSISLEADPLGVA